MEVKFQDFYGQRIEINNETASGNIRMKVTTCKDLNDVGRVGIDKVEASEIIETDISLDEFDLKILIGALQKMEIN